MLNSKLVSISKYDPTGPIRVVVSKSIANLISILINHKTKYVMQTAKTVFGGLLLQFISLYNVALRIVMEDKTGILYELKNRPYGI